LKETFKVEEMSSISTLEVAWENWAYKSLWLNETDFCERVARTNKLELLKWAREEKKCEWDEDTINAAASQGNLEMVKYCVAKKCPIYEDACLSAARNGHLEVLKYLREEVKARWDGWTATRAAQNGHLHILEYLVERKYDEFHELAYLYAAEKGHLDCLKYLRETAKAPWNSQAIFMARVNKHFECVQYLLDNNCPIPDGWRYEDGKLHVPESDSELDSESESELDFFE
jgi:ankyrin repeat protein